MKIRMINSPTLKKLDTDIVGLKDIGDSSNIDKETGLKKKQVAGSRI